MSASWQIIVGDCRDRLAELPERSVHTIVTSPPYFGLRDYGTADWDGGDAACDHTPARPPRQDRPRGGLTGGTATIDAQDAGAVPYRDRCGKCGAARVDRQIGLEPTPDDFVDALVAVFREVRRVLRDDGTAWLNLGDSYYSPTATQGRNEQKSPATSTLADHGTDGRSPALDVQAPTTYRRVAAGCKPKDLIGIPWLVAFALRADGWHLRSEVIWHKPNPMPESITDRPTKAHEHVFLLSKSPRYYYDADAIREPLEEVWSPEGKGRTVRDGVDTSGGGQGNGRIGWNPAGRNKRDVWTVATHPYAGAHFATFPPKLVEPCVLAGAPEKACDACGAPWQRIIEREKHPTRDVEAQRAHYAAQTGRSDGKVAGPGGMIDNVRTIGFEPSCACGAGVTAGVVLDPFSGAGTTGLVALRNGRSYVGLELNPEYAELARDRIRDDAPLFNTPAEVAA